ncbi:MAG: helix-turn-helix transcriptional regulator [Flavobacteriales bacterium]|nr:helix-turn-helix transcriptional regulator [Flavobacteriales bacterium]
MEAEEIILKNIRLYRKVKEIKSENMARELGMSQSEYSKLENGLKRKWTEHLPNISKVLGVTFEELVNLNIVSEGHVAGNSYQTKASGTHPSFPDIELYERLIHELKEKDRLKDELLNSLTLSKENYKQKYESIKAKFQFNSGI